MAENYGKIAPAVWAQIASEFTSQNNTINLGDIYIALSKAEPTLNKSSYYFEGVEEPASAQNYARKSLGKYSQPDTLLFGAPTVAEDGKVTCTNKSEIHFDTVGAEGWGTISHWALFDAATGGHCIAYGPIVNGENSPTPLTPVADRVVLFKKGAVTIEFN